MNKLNSSFLLKHFHYFYNIFFRFVVDVVQDIRTVNSTTALPARYERAAVTIPVASYRTTQTSRARGSIRPDPGGRYRKCKTDPEYS
jgi:hypothetical protein